MLYEIKGGNLPVVICTVEPKETMITERGSMCWMSPNMKMETKGNGGVGKMLGRMFSGDSLFQNRYTAEGGQGTIAFASSFPGSIIPFQVTPDKPIIVQKSGFLASESSVELSIHFQKKVGAGFFGGEGFIMQKLSGHGTAFVEVDGSVVEYTLQPGQQMIVDTGYLAAMDETVKMDIKSTGGLKNMVFGGEGLFNTILTGPGKIYLQTHPLSGIADCLRPFLQNQNG